MYSNYEQPEIRATILYYDREYSQETAEKVIEVAEQFNIFPPSKINAGKLTRGRFQKYRPSMRKIAIQAYSEKDVLSLFWEQNGMKETSDSFSFRWTFTFHKLSDLHFTNSTFNPWNTLTISAPYSWLKDETNYANFMNAFRAFIGVLNPFYANIDDIDQAVTLLQKVHAPCFVPDTIQQIYWGNYWGREFQHQIEAFQSRNHQVYHFEEINGGIFFALSESVFDFNSKAVNALRKKIFAGIK